MKLSLENGKFYFQPSETEILDALSSLCNEGNGFAILESENGQFIQAALNSDNSFLVSHSDSGKIDDLFVSCGYPTSLENCVEAFRDFASGGDKWKSMFKWKSYDAEDYTISGKSKWILLISFILIALASIMTILF